MAQQASKNATSSLHVPWWRRISSGLIANSLFLGIVPLTLVIIVTLLLTRNQINTQIFRQLESVSVLKQQQVSEWIDRGHTALQVVMNNTDTNAAMVQMLEDTASGVQADNKVDSILSNVVDADLYFSSMFVYTLEGQIIAASDDILVGRVVNRQPYFRASRDGDSHTQSPYYDVGSQNLTLVITYPIFGDNNEQIGVLAGALNTEALEQIMLERTGLGETGETYLVSSENNYLLTASHFEGYDSNQAYTSEGINKALQGESGEATYTGYRGVDVVGNYQWIPEIQSALLAEVEVTEAFSIIRQLNMVAFGIGVIVAVLAVSIGSYNSLRLSRPITELATVATQISQGALSQRVDISAQNEIGQLAASFNEMTSQLEELIGSLEHRVADRTRDIEVASSVTAKVTSIRNQDELLQEIVNLTREGFGLDQVSVYLFNEETDDLTIASASGSASQAMLDEKRTFHLDGKGLVPLAARQQSAQIINDVSQSQDHVSNPHLAKTKSEMALPIRVGERLIGVLDLQSNQANRFSEEDVRAITPLAEQIGIGAESASLYAQQADLIKQLRAADEMKSQFLASMSHELRTPLNSILTFSDLMSMGTFGEVNDEQVDYLQKILFSGRHLLALINDVLDISKMESGMMKLFVEEDFDIEAEVNAARSTIEKMIDKKPVKLVVDIDKDLPLLTVDKRRVRQILLNILSNAVKFTEEGTITLSAKSKRDEILFAIIDTGPGIDENMHERIFEPFIQTETGIRHAGGTGLGLPISKRLAEAHGGRLWLESTVGEGSAFFFTLPVSPVVQLGEIAMATH